MPEREKPESLEPIPAQFQRLGWQIDAYIAVEGGLWINVDGGTHPPDAIAVCHRNGWIYDFSQRAQGHNPWRHIDDES